MTGLVGYIVCVWVVVTSIVNGYLRGERAQLFHWGMFSRISVLTTDLHDQFGCVANPYDEVIPGHVFLNTTELLDLLTYWKSQGRVVTGTAKLVWAEGVVTILVTEKHVVMADD